MNTETFLSSPLHNTVRGEGSNIAHSQVVAASITAAVEPAVRGAQGIIAEFDEFVEGPSGC